MTTSFPGSQYIPKDVLPAEPNVLSTMISFSTCLASSFVVGMMTPLPAAKPDALITTLYDTLSMYCMASSKEEKFCYWYE
jgi:hypothetical protein